MHKLFLTVIHITLFLSVLTRSGVLYAQDFRIPVDATCGFLTGGSGPTQFRGSIEAASVFVVKSNFRLGPSIMFSHLHSSWFGSAGVRAEYRFAQLFTPDVGFFGMSDVQFFGDGKTPLSLGLILDAGGFFRTGARIIRDFNRDETSWSLQLGIDLVTLATISKDREPSSTRNH